VSTTRSAFELFELRGGVRSAGSTCTLLSRIPLMCLSCLLPSSIRSAPHPMLMSQALMRHKQLQHASIDASLVVVVISRSVDDSDEAENPLTNNGSVTS